MKDLEIADTIARLIDRASQEPDRLSLDDQYTYAAIAAVLKANLEGRTRDLARIAGIAAVPYWETTLRAVDKLLGDADANGYRYDSQPKRHDQS